MGLRFSLPATGGYITNSATGSRPIEADYDGYPVTPSNTVDLTNGNTKGLYATTAGNIAVVFAGGATATIAVTAGQFVLASVSRVNATGTTATGIFALY